MNYGNFLTNLKRGTVNIVITPPGEEEIADGRLNVNNRGDLLQIYLLGI